MILGRGKLEVLTNKDGSLGSWEYQYIGKGHYEATIILDYNRYSGFGKDKDSALKNALSNYANYYNVEMIR